jgi:restriction system protein
VWEATIRHDGLHKCRVIRGSSKDIVDEKASAQLKLWDEMWLRKCEKDKKRADAQQRWNKKNQAVEKTKEAEGIIESVRGILKESIKDANKFSWEDLLDKSEFSKNAPPRPLLYEAPREPQAEQFYFFPKKGFFDYFSKKKWKRKLDEAAKAAEMLFKTAHVKWREEVRLVAEKNKKMERQYDGDWQRWENAKRDYLKERDAKNKKIIERKEMYSKKQKDAITDYCEMVLSKHQSMYPETFPQEFEIDYNEESQLLLVDYFLPSRENIQTLKEVKYSTAKDEFLEVYLSEKASNELYDTLLYQLTLLTIHQLYKADEINAISSLVFNGYVRFIDKGTGKESTACILSIQAFKKDFQEINLENIEPKECFKKLKGIGSSKLHGLAAIAPIMQIDKEDKRFVAPYTVTDGVNEATNLAAMDWQDFENLIREIFEKQFSTNGGEVKITRTSRDEGVDAVAFDPDPVRGGKIIIQAKRYTNTVGVSAVRDLYGTVMNEGAMKGILVTTTDYGPDAYRFAQDKPLTLLNGSNLLHLLAKHGHKAKIDIKEARKTLNLKDRDENRNY